MFQHGKQHSRKNMDNDITVVTNFFDIGRGKLPPMVRGQVLPHFQHRSTDTYFEYFARLAKLQNQMIVYTTKEFADRIYDLRDKNGLSELTDVVVLESFLPEGFQEIRERVAQIQQSPEYYNRARFPHFVEYWWDDYIMIQLMKCFYIANAIETGRVKNDLTAWIDFGYCRNDQTLPASNRWTYNFDREKIHLFNLRPIEPQRPIDDIIFSGDVYIMGCHMVAATKKWNLFKNYILKSFYLLLQNNLVHYDQTLYLMSYLLHPEEFELHGMNPVNHDWFLIFKDFNDQA